MVECTCALVKILDQLLRWNDPITYHQAQAWPTISSGNYTL